MTSSARSKIDGGTEAKRLGGLEIHGHLKDSCRRQTSPVTEVLRPSVLKNHRHEVPGDGVRHGRRLLLTVSLTALLTKPGRGDAAE